MGSWDLNLDLFDFVCQEYSLRVAENSSDYWVLNDSLFF